MSKPKIDKLFQKKLENWESTPGSDAWLQIESDLSGKKRKGLYWRLAVAATILLIFSFGYIFWDRSLTGKVNQLSETNEIDTPMESGDKEITLSDAVSIPAPEETTTEEKKTNTLKKDDPLPIMDDSNNVPQQIIIENRQPLALENNVEEGLESMENEKLLPESENSVLAIAQDENPEPEKRELLPITIEYRSGVVAKVSPEPEERKGIVKQIQHLAKEAKGSDINLGRLRQAKDEFFAFDKKKEKKEEINN